MAGQKIFTMVSKRLQETRPHYKDKSFGNLSVVLLVDFKQLPKVCDYLIFKAYPSEYNLYQVFDKATSPYRTCATAMSRPIRLQGQTDAPV